ncbi:hypothetical protein DAO80_11425 [Salmonella enterica subsp. enterica serovar Enteritidis]|nr:hypothetical protein [Salmonella enterica subsp. enterica serovar Enteritidis]EEC5061172.1 hypothetical protein [Salmonella enterica subsp. enterica serovar Enteritidis]
MIPSSPKELAELLGAKVECHPNVNPATGLRWDGTIASHEEIGLTVTFPKPMPALIALAANPKFYREEYTMSQSENAKQVIVDTLQDFDPEEFGPDADGGETRAAHIAEIIEEALKEKGFL